MSFKNLLPFAFVVAALAACKAPSASTTTKATTTSTITVDAQTAQEIYFPTWWVEQGYANKPGSATVVVFTEKHKGAKILTRTQSFTQLTEMGTITITPSGSDVTLDVSAYPEIQFGLGSDGKWNGQVIYNGKTLVKGKQDIFLTDIEDSKYRGTGNLAVDNDQPESKRTWQYWAQITKMGPSFDMLFAVSHMPTNGETISPYAKQVVELEREKKRYFKGKVSDWGDYLVITAPPLGNGIQWPNYVRPPMTIKGFYNRSTKELKLEADKMFSYELKNTTSDTNSFLREYVETIKPNSGGKGTLKPFR